MDALPLMSFPSPTPRYQSGVRSSFDWDRYSQGRILTLLRLIRPIIGGNELLED